MRINSTACCAILCAALTFSCSNGVKRIDDQRVMIGNEVYVLLENYEYLRDNEWKIICAVLDSLPTAELLDKEIATGILAPEDIYLDPVLYNFCDNLSLLPYYLDAQIRNPYNISAKDNVSAIVDLCSILSNDMRLMELCKAVALKTFDIHYKNDSTARDKILKAEFDSDWGSDDHDRRLDSLRARVIAHNDRSALTKLEKYYHGKGDDKGMAIYYKLMLNYEGNGDLAERFYHVLEPYFDSIPEFRLVVHEVLLRAAYCDNDKRAQQLCDSLGFSLCDYRLPSPTE